MKTINKKISPLVNANPTLKLIAVILIIVLTFMSKTILSFSGVFLIVLIIWILSKPTAKANLSIVIYTIFAFILLFIINYLTVKTPFVCIFRPDTVHTWFGKTNIGTPINVNDYDIFVSRIYGGRTFFDIDKIYAFDNANKASDYFKDHLTNIGWQFKVYRIPNTNEYICVEYTSTAYSLTMVSIFFPAQITFKIIMMIMIVTAFVKVTDNIQLNYAFLNLMYPLKIFRAPIKTWSTIFSLAIRFIPSLIEESKVILKAQASRGVDFGNGNFKDKMKSLTSLIIPMFTISFVKAVDLANAMDVRNFDPSVPNTEYRKYSLTWQNIFFSMLIFIIFGLTIMLAIYKITLPAFEQVDLQMIHGG